MRSIDPRARLIAVLLATIAVTTTPAGNWMPFAAYFGLILLSGVPLPFLLRRALAAAPFILLASGMLLLRESWTIAAAVAVKAGMAVALLALLSATTTLPELIWALRKLHVPESFHLMLTLMSRYIGLLSEEYKRLDRARESRTARPLGRAAYKIHARQLGTLLLRSWDRAERIHTAMVSRGFEKSWPVRRTFRFAVRDAVFLLSAALPWVAIRLLLTS